MGSFHLQICKLTKYVLAASASKNRSNSLFFSYDSYDFDELFDDEENLLDNQKLQELVLDWHKYVAITILYNFN